MKIRDINGKVNEGWSNVRPINRERYGERTGLEGPFQTKAGKVVYYDPKEGSYYDPDTDMYLTYDEWKALDEAEYQPKGKRRPTQKDWYHKLKNDYYSLDPNGIEQDTIGDPGYETTVNILNFTLYDGEGNDIGTGEIGDYFGTMHIDLYTGQTVTIDDANHPLVKDARSILDGGVNESLPPHLAKYVDDKGDFTPDAKSRLGKGGERRLLTKPAGTISSKDRTPKGYGPVDEGVTDNFVKVDKRIFHGMEDRGAIFNFSTGGLYLNDKLIGYRGDAGDDGDRYYYDYFVAPEFAEPAVAETINEEPGNFTTYLIVKTANGRPTNEWALMDYENKHGSNPQGLRTKLDEFAKSLGWGGYNVITQWNGDINQVLATAQEKLSSGKKWIYSYEMSLKNTVRDLSKAKEIMASGKEVKPANTEASDPMNVINKFLDKKKAKERRSADLAKNPHKVNMLKTDEPLEEKPTDSDYAIGMAQAKKSTGDNPPLSKSTIKKAHKIARAVAREEGVEEDREWANSRAAKARTGKVYNPGVSQLERTITLEPDEIQKVKKALWSVPGIDMKVRGDQVTFKTAKIKTLAKILNKVIDFDATDVGSVLDVPAEIGPIESVEEEDGYQQWPGQKKKKFYQAPKDKDGKTETQKWAEKRRAEREAKTNVGEANFGTGMKSFRKASHNNKDPRMMKLKLMLSGPEFIQQIAKDPEGKPNLGDKVFLKMMKALGIPREGELQRRIAKKLVASGEYKKAVTPKFGMMAYTDDEIKELYQRYIVNGEDPRNDLSLDDVYPAVKKAFAGKQLSGIGWTDDRNVAVKDMEGNTWIYDPVTKKKTVQEADVGDKVKYRNIKSKRNKTGTVRKVSKDQHGANKYELDGGKIVYDQDLEEGMPPAGKKVVVALKGEKVKEFTLPPHARSHHIVQELRKVQLGLSDYELQNAARALANGQVFRSGTLAMQVQDSRPREMESVKETKTRKPHDPWTPDAPIPDRFRRNGKLVKDAKYRAWVEQQKKKQSVEEDRASDYGVSDAQRNPSIERSKYQSNHKPSKTNDRDQERRDREAGMAMDAMTVAKRKKERAMFGEDNHQFSVGDKVIALKGPHKGDVHEVIHCFDDGSCNVRPLTHRVKYRMGAAKANPADLKPAE